MTLPKAALFTVVGSVSVFSIFIKMYHSLVGKKEQNTEEFPNGCIVPHVKH